MLKKIRDYLSFESSALLVCVLTVLLATLQMACGIRLTCVPLVLSLIVVGVLFAGVSWKQAFFLGVLLAVACVLPFTWDTIWHNDVIGCYAAEERLLINGWNPFYESSLSDIEKYASPDHFRVWHMLYTPRFVAIFGACVARLGNAFLGDMALGVVLLTLLPIVTYRFAKTALDSRLLSAFLALVVMSCTKVNSFFVGTYDYYLYALLLISLFAVELWLVEKKKSDLLLIVLAAGACAAIKPLGLIYEVMVLLYFLMRTRASKISWIASGAVMALILCFLANPYLQALVQTGTMKPPMDLTSDFGGNADALAMSRIGRIIYAWFSPKLALAIESLAHGRSFNPVFSRNVEGFGGIFRALMLVGIMALFLSKRTPLTYVTIFLLITVNLVPLRYVGFQRYALQVWAVPFLAFANLAANPRFAFSPKVFCVVRSATVLTFGFFACLILVRAASLFRQLQVCNALREVELPVIRERGINELEIVSGYERRLYIMHEWLRDRGCFFVSDGSGVRIYMDHEIVAPSLSPDIVSRREDVQRKYPICNDLKSFIRGLER